VAARQGAGLQGGCRGGFGAAIVCSGDRPRLAEVREGVGQQVRIGGGGQPLDGGSLSPPAGEGAGGGRGREQW
jgi:hypothetical protein